MRYAYIKCIMQVYYSVCNARTALQTKHCHYTSFSFSVCRFGGSHDSHNRHEPHFLPPRTPSQTLPPHHLCVLLAHWPPHGNRGDYIHNLVITLGLFYSLIFVLSWFMLSKSDHVIIKEKIWDLSVNHVLLYFLHWLNRVACISSSYLITIPAVEWPSCYLPLHSQYVLAGFMVSNNTKSPL